MPRLADSPMSDQSDEEMVETKIKQVEEDDDIEEVKVAKVEEDQDMGDGDNDEDDDDEALDEDEYVIEKILRHKFEDGQLYFLIKWVGYEKKSDQTWEPEDNCTGAPDAIASYFKEIGGRPVLKPPGKTPTGKRGPRNSQSSTPVTSTKGKKQKSEEASAIDTWKPPLGEESWEDEVRCIDTLERSDEGIVCFVHWNNGRKTQHPAHVVYKKCPQHMLRFYEGHLVFRPEEDPSEHS